MPTEIVTETCPTPECNLTEQDIRQFLEEMTGYIEMFEPAFQRAEQLEWSKAYLWGLLGDTPRKNVERMALDWGDKARSMQYFIGQSPWKPEPATVIHQRLVVETLGEEDGVALIDESGVVKQGDDSVGVAPQYCDSVGKVANSQVGVYLGYANRKGYSLIERQLFMPERWFDDEHAAKRMACGLPQGVQPKTKPEIGLELLQRAIQRDGCPLPVDQASGQPLGGTRNGTVVHWPNGIKAKGEIRNQSHHVIDVAPTILEAACLPQPVMVNGVQQKPMEGVSMTYSFDDPRAAERHETQYFEMFVNRGIYHKGWTAVTRHSTPWPTPGGFNLPAYDEDTWELYGPDDWTQAHDLARDMPEKLHALQRLFLIEAAKYNILPLDDRRVERFNSDLAGRPVLIRGKSQLFFSGMGRLGENVVLNTKNKSYSVTAQVVLPEKDTNGVIVAIGGGSGGWSVYAKDGRLKFCYNWLGIQHYYAESSSTLPAGKHQVRMEFAYDGGGLAQGGGATLYLDGNLVGEGRIEHTQPMIFSVDETLDVGCENATMVAEDYTAGTSKFNGKINWVQIDQGVDDHDHLISPEERLRLAMSRQ